MKRLFVLSFLLSLFIIGCDQNPYQITKGENGAIYKLNKKTGEISIIKDDKIIKLELAESEEYKKWLNKILEDPIGWGEQEVSGKELKVTLRTSWRDGKLYYEFKAFPYLSLRKIYSLRYSSNSADYYTWVGQQFSVQLYDKNGFIIKEIPVYVKDMTLVVNEKGEGVELAINSNIETTKSDYQAIAGYSIEWSLKSDLIPNKERDSKDKINKNETPLKATSEVLPEGINLEGILYDAQNKNNSTAIINGQTVKELDKVNGYYITEIKPKSVILQKDKDKFEINLKE